MKWLVPDILLEDGIHVVHGLEETFKTMLTLQLHEKLSKGGRFLLRDMPGGLVTGIAELEMKNRRFGHRLARFFPTSPPDIRVLSVALYASTAKERIGVIAQWAQREGARRLHRSANHCSGLIARR